MPRTSNPKDGWCGKTFRKLREARGRSRSWVASETGVTEQSVYLYERDSKFPPHTWRDAASLAMKLDRRLLGVGEE